MYIDITFRKMLLLAVIAAILWSAVSVTFALKEDRFGSTPFYASVLLAWQEGVGHVGYTLRDFISHAPERLAGLFGFSASASIPSDDAIAIPVLTYHRIVDRPDGVNVTVDNFRDQMETLHSNGWDTITLEDFKAFMRGTETLPERSVLITFDDGAKQSFYPVDPVLAVLGFNAVNYIIVSGSETPESTYYLGEEEIRRLLESGRWEIGSHSYDAHHPYAVDAAGTVGNFFADKLWLPEEERLETESEFRTRVANDLGNSKRMLAETYGRTVDTFAFPFGETGLYVAGNFARGAGISETEAARIYDRGWLQTERGRYSFNYPNDSFIAWRISVGSSWSGRDLLSVLERGLPKRLPYADPLDNDRGWIHTWGRADVRDGRLELRAAPDSTGASAFQDGTAGWRNIDVTADVSWESGYASAMAQVEHASSYRACVFSRGQVRLQHVFPEDTRILLGEASVPSIVPGATKTLGIQTKEGSTDCVWNGIVVLSVSGLRERSGGVGFQIWDPVEGTASLDITHLSVTSAADAPIRSVYTPPVSPPLFVATEIPVPSPMIEHQATSLPSATPSESTTTVSRDDNEDDKVRDVRRRLREHIENLVREKFRTNVERQREERGR